MNISIIQSMINAIDKPAIFITPDYVIHAVNQPYRDTYQDDVITGQSRCHQISHRNSVPCDQAGESCPLAECQQSGRATTVVHNHKTQHGDSYCDILMKPVHDEDGMVLGFLEILERIQYASSQAGKGKLIGNAPSFRQMLQQISRAAPADIAVLLQGETGSGKELVAQAIHDSSKRSKEAFVVIECTGLTETLFESELFGYEKGAFTGASTSKKGLIDAADGGTVFFDEIGDVPLSMQVKLLRLLETGSYRPVGSLKQRKSNFRLVCATHKNLKEMVEKGQFRQDLYYRIAGFPILLPSLRQRREDIAELCHHFLIQTGHADKGFTRETLLLLSRYSFPGNIRELRNIVEQSALLSVDELITPADLPMHLSVQNTAGEPEFTPHLKTLDEAEASYLSDIAATYDGTPESLAEVLGVSTRTLYRKLQRYGLTLRKR